MLKDVLDSIRVQERGVYVQASTLGSLEALLEFLRTSKIPVRLMCLAASSCQPVSTFTTDSLFTLFTCDNVIYYIPVAIIHYYKFTTQYILLNIQIIHILSFLDIQHDIFYYPVITINTPYHPYRRYHGNPLISPYHPSLQCSGINIGPVHKKDIMKASVMIEHDSQLVHMIQYTCTQCYRLTTLQL